MGTPSTVVIVLEGEGGEGGDQMSIYVKRYSSRIFLNILISMIYIEWK